MLMQTSSRTKANRISEAVSNQASQQHSRAAMSCLAPSAHDQAVVQHLTQTAFEKPLLRICPWPSGSRVEVCTQACSGGRPCPATVVQKCASKKVKEILPSRLQSPGITSRCGRRDQEDLGHSPARLRQFC